MRTKYWLLLLGSGIAIFAIIVTVFGILSSGGEGGLFTYTWRGEWVELYNKGVYKHMAIDDARQGIAQDYVTLFIAVPVLLVSLYYTMKDVFKARIVLAGVLSYFLLTYLFYTTMTMYNALFLLYVGLLALSFFAFIITMFYFNETIINARYKGDDAFKTAGIFMIIVSTFIALMWLQGILNPLLDPLLENRLYPDSLKHYTTLIVQGLDLGIFLPSVFVIGVLTIHKHYLGLMFTPVALVFLSFIMVSLSAKFLFMGLAGEPVIPLLIIVFSIAVLAILQSYRIIHTRILVK